MERSQRLADLGRRADELGKDLDSLVEELRRAEDVGLEGLEALQHEVRDVVLSLTSAGARAGELSRVVDEAIDHWWRANQFSDTAFAVTLSRLMETAQADTSRARRMLLDEVAVALHALALGYAVQLLRGAEAWSGITPDTVDDVGAWQQGDLRRGIRAVGRLRELLTERRQDRSRRAGAIITATEAVLNHRAGNLDRATELVDELVQQAPTDAFAHVERAGLSLAAGAGEAAGEEAHRAIELDPADPRPYVQAGVVAESLGDFVNAMELYDEGARRLLGAAPLISAPEWASFLKPTGLFFLMWAKALREHRLLSKALTAVDRALAEGVAGASPYPEADAHDVHWRLLEDVDAPLPEVTSAAFDAGKRHYWNNDHQRAVEALRLATRAEGHIPDAGWYLAASLAAQNDPDCSRLAAETWDDWRNLVGSPAPKDAWAYALRAALETVVTPTDDVGTAPYAWRGIVLCEKGLVLDPLEAELWATLCRNLRILGLRKLALEAVEGGYQVNPDNQSILHERVAVLGDEGRLPEALETWDRIPDAARDPWLSGVKALLLRLLGRPEEAIEYLELPLSGSWDLGWYRDLRAACYVDLGRLDEAVEDLRALPDDEAPWSGQARGRRIHAWCVLDELQKAHAELDAAMDDQTMIPAERAFAAALVSLVSGDVTSAGVDFDRAVAASTDPVTVDDLVRALDRFLQLRRHTGRPVPGGPEVLLRLKTTAEAWTPNRSTADDDLDGALKASAQAPSSAESRVALSAVQARRHLKQGRAEVAAELYAELVGSIFDPESEEALAQALNYSYRDAVWRGDVDRTQAAFGRLQALHRAPVPVLEIAVAEALKGGGRYTEAVATLSEVLPRATEASTRLLVLERLGECALFGGQLELAESSLDEAFGLAVAAEDHSKAARIAVRMSVATLLAGRPAAVASHLQRALREWSAARTWNPRLVLKHELGWVLDALPDESATGLARQGLRTILAHIGPAGEAP